MRRMKPTNRIAGFILAMTTAKALRGRPKGTGINDQQRLAEIARLVHGDPSIKPTTAIKALGITDPSAIRRLRDKFNLTQGQPAKERVAVSSMGVSSPAPAYRSVSGSNSTTAANDATPALRSTPASVPKPVMASAIDPKGAFAAGTGLLSTAPARSEPYDHIPMAAMMLGFGLNAATALFEQQMTLATNLLKVPQVRDMVRSQIALTEFMLSVARPSPGSRLTH